MPNAKQSRQYRLLCLTLCVLTSTAVYSQNSNPDSACYSAAENAAITRSLLELKALREQMPLLEKSVAYYQAQQESLRPTLDRYVEKRRFLGIGSRKARRKLRAELLRIAE
ncbi:hypothetical protein [Spirosoma sp. 209]|uniref:hypothetical protein n=1 Tax=Spirosoma sp. 209 TaxID=1955701 RepID=UPI00098D4D2E|nr:hypothetical protein [Spirosoma sp. 209]